MIKGAGDQVTRVYFPTHGLISSRAVLESGHEIECALVGKTNGLGILAALGFDHGSAHFVCLTDGHAWAIELPHLVAAMQISPAVERQLKLFCIAQMGYGIHVGVCNAMHGGEQRLARWLTNAAELLGDPEIRLRQEELATVLGLQRSAVNPALQKLKTEGLIDVSRGRILVVDSERLRRRACECHPALRRALCLDQGLDGSGVPASVIPWVPLA